MLPETAQNLTATKQEQQQQNFSSENKKNHAAMATATTRAGRPSSFSRHPSSPSAAAPPTIPGIRAGPGGVAFVSSGISDLDKILGGGFLLGTVVMVVEDAEAPHHLLLLRNFMSQGVVQRQPVLFASPAKNPRAFLGTLPAPVSSSSSKDDSQRAPNSVPDGEDQKGLRIAWQYKKYFGEQQVGDALNRDSKQEFSNDFDLRKPLERHLLGVQYIDCTSIQASPDLAVLHSHCSTFLSKLSRKDGSNDRAGRIAIQSLCAPQCKYFDMDWEIVSFIKSLRAMVRSSNAVAVITFPTSLLSASFSKRWQHLADTLLSVRAIPDDDKDLAKLLTGYQDMVGFLHVHKVAQVNSQVPVILEATTFSLKLERRRYLVLERLNQAPIDGSSGTSYASSSSCSGSSKGTSLDF